MRPDQALHKLHHLTQDVGFLLYLFAFLVIPMTASSELISAVINGDLPLAVAREAIGTVGMSGALVRLGHHLRSKARTLTTDAREDQATA